MIIKLSQGEMYRGGSDNGPVYVNTDEIAAINTRVPDRGWQCSTVILTSGEKLLVNESPDAIARLIPATVQP